MTPRPDARTGAVTRLAGALAAVILLVAILAGIPALMTGLGLVPHALPAWRQITAALTQRDTGQLVVVILAAAIWICWALFVVSLITEILAAVRRRPARLLPGLAVFQRPAGALVAAIMIGLLVAPTVGGAAAPLAAAAPTATAWTADPVQHLAAPHRSTAATLDAARAPRPAAGPTYVVQPRDTLWGIAELTMGNPLRYTEILALNPAGIGADNEITPGAALTLPADATVARAPAAATTSDTDVADAAGDTGGPVRVTVRPGDTLSGITQRITGHADLYPEVAAANTIHDPNVIEPGQVITIPAHLIPTTDSTPQGGTTVTVRPGDTLSGITQRAAGHADQWPAVWHANQGRAEPGGTRFDDPDRIYPGWTITIPAPAHDDTSTAAPDPTPAASQHTTHPRPATHPTTPTATSTPAATGPAATGPADPAPQPGSHGPARSAGPTADSPSIPITGQRPAPAAAESNPGHPTNTTMAAGGPADPAPSETAHPVAADPGAPPAASAHPHAADPWAQLATFTAGGGVLLAGVTLTALRAYRRGQFRRRRPGRMIATDPTVTAAERGVLAAGSAGVSDVMFLDRALRGLAHTAPDRDGRMPDVVAARLSPAGLTLVLATPDEQPPTPWLADAGGTRWSIGRGDDTGFRDDRRDYDLAPYPTLVCVGHTDTGEEWLLDLERVGCLTLAGDSGRAVNLARYIAAELAHNTWSEMLTITMVGFGAELVPANPDRLTHTADLTAAAAAAASLGAPDGDGVLVGRAGPVGEEWAPHVLLVADTGPHTDAAALDAVRAAIARTPGRGRLALVTAGLETSTDDLVGWQLRVDDDGTMTIPQLGLRVIAQQVPADEAADLAQMLAVSAEGDDTPFPPARGARAWEADSDSAGALVLPAGPRPSHAGAGLHLAEDTGEHNSLLPLPDQAYLDSAAVDTDELPLLAPVVDEQVRARVEAADPTLESDLADWFDSACPRPRVTVLGPPTVRAAGTLPDRSPQRRANTEAVIYLATRGPEGVSSTVFAETMWPGDRTVVGKSKVANMIWAVRSWLGADPVTGQHYLPSGRGNPGTARYRIDGALIDADLFRRLRTRGMARGADGIRDLKRALLLVGGPPFDGIIERRSHDDPGPGGWLWLTEANARLDLEYTGMIVDTAHTVATHHLTAGDPVQAANVIRIGLNAGGYDDILLLDLIEACEAQGLGGEAAAYEAQIRANYDGAELPERTEEILRRIHARHRSSDRRLATG